MRLELICVVMCTIGCVHLTMNMFSCLIVVKIVRPIYVNCLMIINNIFYINILVIKSISIWGIKFVTNKAAGINNTRDALAMKIYHNNFCTHSLMV